MPGLQACISCAPLDCIKFERVTLWQHMVLYLVRPIARAEMAYIFWRQETVEIW